MNTDLCEAADATVRQGADLLGSEVAAQWRAAAFDAAAFPAIAAECLSRSKLLDTNADSLADWVIDSPWLPLQANLLSPFGEAPLTLFWHPRFYIEALHWTLGSPDIHEHAFDGAFAVLQGSSVHTTYRFEETRHVSDAMSLGRLSMVSAELLRQSAVRPIIAGPALIHSTFHLDTPSVTIVVRTPRNQRYLPQHTFHRPNVAIDPSVTDPSMRRRLEMLAFVERTQPARLADLASKCIEKATVEETYRLLEQLHRTERGRQDSRACSDMAKSLHGDVIDELRPALEERERDLFIRSRRAVVRNAELRLFIALLLNVNSRRRIFDIIRDVKPGVPVAQVAADWAYMLTGVAISGIEFDDLNKKLFLHLISGRSDADAIGALAGAATTTDTDTVEGLKARCAMMRQSFMFRTLCND